MTRNTVHRLLIVAIGVPSFVAIVKYLSFGRNLIVTAIVLLIQYLAVKEFSTLLETKGQKPDRTFLTALSLMLSILVYVAPYLVRLLPRTPSTIEVLFTGAMLGNLLILAPHAFSRQKDFPALLASVSGSILIFFYCGILGSFLEYIVSGFEFHAAPIFVFTLMTFGNDSLAWLFGVTMGRRRGLVDVSPGKSLAGFIGGFMGSLVAGIISYFLFRDSGFSSPLPIFLLSAVMGLSVLIGDLVESGFKRSAGVKDSSSLVPGRGGILDSFDSLLFSAPLFVLLSILFGFFSVGG